jgi:hypothetical protein
MRAVSSLFAVTALAIPLVAASPARAAALDPPTLQAVAADRISATLLVRAGDSGAPGGFAISYMRADQYRVSGGWPDESQQSSAFAQVVDCTFAGVPTLDVTPGVPNFCLEPGQAVEVVIGKLFDETGLSATDSDELPEGTEYVFRARAAVTLDGEQSPYSETVAATTTARSFTDCTLTQGFWKRHPDNWSRVASIRLGSVVYARQQLQSILTTPARGNGLISLAHQLIAAKLNQLLGAIPPADVLAAMQQADNLIGALVVPPVGAGSLRPSLVREVLQVLDAFNCGRRGPAHCPSSLDPVPAASETWGRVKIRYR